MEKQFAYGSNMDSRQLDNKGIVLRNPRVAKLENYEFGFTKKGKDGSGKANIVACKNQFVWGILIELNHDEVKNMDKSEGINRKLEPPDYTKEIVRIKTDGGEEECWTYMANFHPKRYDVDGLPPRKEYLEYIVNGATIHNLPSEYIEQIRNTPTFD